VTRRKKRLPIDEARFALRCLTSWWNDPSEPMGPLTVKFLIKMFGETDDLRAKAAREKLRVEGAVTAPAIIRILDGHVPTV
jgi:hypothetical protein